MSSAYGQGGIEVPSGDPSLGFKLAINSLAQIAGVVAASAVSFVTFIAASRGLGPSSYGDFVAAAAFLYVPVALADLGLPTLILREISTAPSRTEHAMRAVLPLRALLSTGAVAAAVGIGLVMPFSEGAKVAILIGSGGAVATLMNFALLPVLQAQLKMHLAVVANLAGRVATLFLTLAALWADFGLAGVAWAQTIGLVITLLIDIVLVRRFVSLSPVFDFAYWRRLVRSSLVLGLALGFGLAYFRVDSLLLAAIRPGREVGLYGAAYKFVELSDLAAVTVTTSVLPVLARFLATTDSRLRGLTQKAFNVLLAFATVISLFMFLYAEELIRLTAGPEFEDGASALRLLAPYPLLSFVNGLFWTFLIAAGRDRTLLVLGGSALTLNVGLNLIFLPEYGFRAAPITALASEACGVAAAAVFVYRVRGFLPRIGYAFVVGLAGAVMAAIALLAPGPPLLIGAVAAVAYALVLSVLPGTVREMVVAFLQRWPRFRRS